MSSILHLLSIIYPIFTSVDPDPHSKYGFGSTRGPEYGSNLDLDRQHCSKLYINVFLQSLKSQRSSYWENQLDPDPQNMNVDLQPCNMLMAAIRWRYYQGLNCSTRRKRPTIVARLKVFKNGALAHAQFWCTAKQEAA